MTQPLLLIAGLLFIVAAFFKPPVPAPPAHAGEQHNAHVLLKSDVDKWREQSRQTQERYRGFVDAEDVARLDYQNKVLHGTDWPAWLSVGTDTLYPGRVQLNVWNDHDLWVKHGYDKYMWSNTIRSLTPHDARTTAELLLKAADDAERWQKQLDADAKHVHQTPAKRTQPGWDDERPD